VELNRKNHIYNKLIYNKAMRNLYGA